MIIKLGSGKKIILDDVIKDEKAEAIEWLQKYKARRQAAPGSTTGRSSASVDLKGGMGK